MTPVTSRPIALPQAGSKNPGDGRAIGRTRGGLNTKLHLVCDGAGKPVRLHITAGNRAEITQARQCLEGHVRKGATVIADRGYDADHLRQWLAGIGATPCIPPRRNRKAQCEYDAALYKSRNIIERMFNRLKDWRQLSFADLPMRRKHSSPQHRSPRPSYGIYEFTP